MDLEYGLVQHQIGPKIMISKQVASNKIHSIARGCSRFSDHQATLSSIPLGCSNPLSQEATYMGAPGEGHTGLCMGRLL